MSAALVRLAREKELLLARSALCRLRLRCQTQSLRDGLPWNRAAHALSAAPSYRRLAFGLVLSFVGLGRSASVIMQAGRIVVLARLVRSIIGGVRTLSGPAPRPGGQAQPELPG